MSMDTKAAINKCKHCGKAKLHHHAGTSNCPGGRKNQKYGYQYFLLTTFEPKPAARWNYHNDLTASRVRELLIYDRDTGLFTYREAGKPAGYIDHGGYWVIFIREKKRIYKAHRLAFLYEYGEWPAADVDHINGVRSDNRIENLRSVVQAINNQNLHGPKSTNSTGLLGVSRSGRRFQAGLRVKGKRIALGTYDTPEEAHQAYIAGKRIHHPGGCL